jgi:hypothetical protein
LEGLGRTGRSSGNPNGDDVADRAQGAVLSDAVAWIGLEAAVERIRTAR